MALDNKIITALEAIDKLKGTGYSTPTGIPSVPSTYRTNQCCTKEMIIEFGGDTKFLTGYQPRLLVMYKDANSTTYITLDPVLFWYVGTSLTEGDSVYNTVNPVSTNHTTQILAITSEMIKPITVPRYTDYIFLGYYKSKEYPSDRKGVPKYRATKEVPSNSSLRDLSFDMEFKYNGDDIAQKLYSYDGKTLYIQYSPTLNYSVYARAIKKSFIPNFTVEAYTTNDGIIIRFSEGIKLEYLIVLSLCGLFNITTDCDSYYCVDKMIAILECFLRGARYVGSTSDTVSYNQAYVELFFSAENIDGLLYNSDAFTHNLIPSNHNGFTGGSEKQIDIYSPTFNNPTQLDTISAFAIHCDEFMEGETTVVTVDLGGKASSVTIDRTLCVRLINHCPNATLSLIYIGKREDDVTNSIYATDEGGYDKSYIMGLSNDYNLYISDNKNPVNGMYDNSVDTEMYAYKVKNGVATKLLDSSADDYIDYIPISTIKNLIQQGYKIEVHCMPYGDDEPY